MGGAASPSAAPPPLAASPRISHGLLPAARTTSAIADGGLGIKLIWPEA